MGLFGKSNKESRRKFGATIVSEGTEFVGELSLPAKLHVDGTFRGKIHSEGDVTVGLSGLVEGNVEARRLVVSGKVKGNVRCETVEVVASGSVVGNVVSREFVVERGAQFEGENHLPDDSRETGAEHTLKTVLTNQASIKGAPETPRDTSDELASPERPAQVRR